MDPNPNDAMEQPLNDTEDSPEVDVNSVEKGSGGDSDESVRDEESLALSDEELDDFFKNAEHLSDQTLGDMRLYDCSLSTDVDKSLSVSQHQHGINDSDVGAGGSLKHFHDLSCSMLVDGEQSISISKVDLVQAVERRFRSELEEKNVLIQELSKRLDQANKLHNGKRLKNLISQASWIRDSLNGFSNLSMCSFEEGKDDSFDSTANKSKSFRLSSYMKKSALPNQEPQQVQQTSVESACEAKSSQTTPTPEETDSSREDQINSTEIIQTLCRSFLSTTKWLKDDLATVKSLMKQPYENHEDFPIQKIMLGLQEISKRHDAEVTSFKDQLAFELKHHHEVQNGLKDDIKTLKMRFQEKIKQRDGEIAELKARLTETNESSQNAPENNTQQEQVDRPFTSHDDSFHSNSDEETFSNLTRTKVEYLKLTPSEYVDDEVIDTVHIPDSYRQLLEDYKLKLFDIEKKFDANKRYLDEQTHDREVERDEFQHTLEVMTNQIEELKRENAKLYEVKKQNAYQIDEYSARLKSAEEDEMEMVQKQEKTEIDLKNAVEKIFELREIIRDLEKQVDSLSSSAIQLKEQNQVLLDELEKQELMNKKEQPIFKEDETYGTIPMDVTEEIQAQLYDLARKIEFKVSEMDNFSINTRPNSSCSGVASAVSTEDISCRELAGRSSRNFENLIEDIGSRMLNAIRRLESQFESLVRFEDVIMKKLKDSDLHCASQKITIEELEGQITIYQEKCSNQSLKIADLEGKIDSLRFESSNQGIISSLKSRLALVVKQIDEFKCMLTSKDKELIKAKDEISSLNMRIAEAPVPVETRDTICQTSPLNESFSFADFTYEGVSPEKIRRMEPESSNRLSTSVASLPRNVLKEGLVVSIEPDLPKLESSDEKNRSRGCHVSVGDDSIMSSEGSPGSPEAHRRHNQRDNGSSTIQEMDDNLQELQRLLAEKDNQIRMLEAQVRSGSNRDGGCEQEDVTLEIDLNPRGGSGRPQKGRKNIEHRGGDGENLVYETMYASEYEVDDGLLRYLGTKLLSSGPRPENTVDYRHGRVQETDRQIEIAKLNTQVHQLQELLKEERRKSERVEKQLRSCEEQKAEQRMRGPTTRAPVQNVASSVSVQQMQHLELVNQIEEGRSLLNAKHKEIRSLNEHVSDLEAKLNAKLEHERELTTRLSSTISLLRRCEEHGRELTSHNQEFSKEIRSLRGQLERASSRNNENFYAAESGNDYFEKFLRAKSHKKALAWQKKYLSSVITGYKSIVRQVGHGIEHPELLQPQIPLAPGAVGLVDVRCLKTRFRIGVLTVLAVIRMKYMVARWKKKRPGEGSPDSDYKASKQTVRFDASIIRPSKGILIHNRTNHIASSERATDNIACRSDDRQHLDDISEYLARFESIENEISSGLSRNTNPIRPIHE